MASHNKIIKSLATKLGLDEEEKVINKAAEFERLLQTKSVVGSNLTDTSKTVICLELAASIFGRDLDNKTAVRYSGLRRPAYMNCRKIVENLLELNSEKLTVSFLCISLQCVEVQPLAGKILEEYLKQKSEIDLNLPQYVCMAVWQACRVKKIKISKSKLIEKSRLKPSQWTKLHADWTKFVDEKFATIKKRTKGSKDDEVFSTNSEKMEVDPSQNEEINGSKTEAYEDWKKRLLENAYVELKELDEKKKKEEKGRTVKEKQLVEKEFTSPRRSPRKTPQKFSPYKSPKKNVANAVRLLFPSY